MNRADTSVKLTVDLNGALWVDVNPLRLPFRMNTNCKLALVLVLASFGIGVAASAGQGQYKAPISVEIKAPSEEVKSGSAVTVRITVTNITEAPIGVKALDVSPYVAIVRGANGILGSETEHGQKLKQKQRERMDPNYIPSGFATTLQPGESMNAVCVVSDLYDMSRPGQYTIQIERIWNRRAVPSNTVKIRVIP